MVGTFEELEAEGELRGLRARRRAARPGGDRRARLHERHDRPAEGRDALPPQPALGGGRFREAFGTTPGRRGPLLPAAVPRRRAAEQRDQRDRHGLRRELRRGRRVVPAGPARRAADDLRRRPARVGEDARHRRDPHGRRVAAQARRRTATRSATGRRLAPKRMAGPLGPPTALRAALAERARAALPARQARPRRGRAIAVCGAAPIAPQVLEWFWALGVPVYEIYGQTENTAICTFMPADDVRIGTVGKPLPDVELRIADDGEILTRSPAVFQGYFRNEEATADAVDADGWLHTGDVGVLDGRRPPDGSPTARRTSSSPRAARTSRRRRSRTSSRSPRTCARRWWSATAASTWSR